MFYAQRCGTISLYGEDWVLTAEEATFPVDLDAILVAKNRICAKWVNVYFVALLLYVGIVIGCKWPMPLVSVSSTNHTL